MDSSNRENSRTGAKRDTHAGKGASALDHGQRSKSPQASDREASGGDAARNADQRDDGRGRDASRNGSDSNAD